MVGKAQRWCTFLPRPRTLIIIRPLSHTLFAWRVSLLILLYRLTGAYKESQLERGCQEGSLHRSGMVAKGEGETGQWKSTVVSDSMQGEKNASQF